MANPTFFGDGSTPRVTDTRWTILQKILGATIDGGSGSGGAYTHGNVDPNGVEAGAIGARYRNDVSGVFWTNTDGTITGWAVG